MAQPKGKQPANATFSANAPNDRQYDSDLGIKPLQRSETTFMEGRTWENLNVLTLGEYLHIALKSSRLTASKMVEVSEDTGL